MSWFEVLFPYLGVALFIFGAYQVGVQVGEERIRKGLERDAAERRRRAEADLSPEERAVIERRRLRDQIREQIIHRLPPEEKVMYTVVNPNDSKQAELERRVECEVDRALADRGAST